MYGGGARPYLLTQPIYYRERHISGALDWKVKIFSLSSDGDGYLLETSRQQYATDRPKNSMFMLKFRHRDKTLGTDYKTNYSVGRHVPKKDWKNKQVIYQ